MSWFFCRHLKGLCCPNRRQSGEERLVSRALGQTVSAAKLLSHKGSRHWWSWQLSLITQLLLTILTGLTGLHVLFLPPGSCTFLSSCFSSWILDSVSTVPSLAVIFTFLNPLYRLSSSSFSAVLGKFRQLCRVMMHRLLNCLWWEKASSRDYRDGTADDFWFMCWQVS